MLGATAIAGFLITIQLQQAGDVINSAKAVFAADAGVNCALYHLNNPNKEGGVCLNETEHIELANRADVVFECHIDDRFNDVSKVSCGNPATTYILSKGTSGTTKRAFLYTILTPPAGP